MPATFDPDHDPVSRLLDPRKCLVPVWRTLVSCTCCIRRQTVPKSQSAIRVNSRAICLRDCAKMTIFAPTRDRWWNLWVVMVDLDYPGVRLAHFMVWVRDIGAVLFCSSFSLSLFTTRWLVICGLSRCLFFEWTYFRKFRS